jgi:eukaryotic-like serine/threonine-protein kinase
VIGTSIGNYQIQRLIGEGGMGKVYLAVHPGIGRQAAVKLLAATDAADPQVVSRFITEARAANAIRHPNIVDIYDSGVLAAGTPYIVMEYLDGETLYQVLLRGALPIADVFDWGCQIAEALSAAHVRDVVHRDLKPDNLFLIPDPRRLGKRQVKVLDFGIAKLQRGTLGQVHKTRTGSLLGTPLYMSPEQCVGDKNVDQHTDIYSLGVILYEMVTGKRPFDSEGVYEVIHMHVNQPPTPPSQHRPDVPPELETIILRALAKAPAQRQPSMAVLLSELELARGNPAASSEALARVQRETVRAIPLPDAQRLSEIKTLGDTAVSKSVNAQTATGRSSPRFGLLLASALVIVIGAVYALGPFGRKAAVPVESKAPAVPVVAAPVIPAAPPPAPARVEIGLDSVPRGAEVLVGDVLLGETPTRYESVPTNDPVEFVFRLPGYEPERIRALPARGLSISAKFSTPIPAKKPMPGRHKPVHKPERGPSADIQTER